MPVVQICSLIIVAMFIIVLTTIVIKDKPRRAFQFLWQRTRDPKSWDADLWVRVIKFEPINTNIDEVLWHAW